MTFLNPWMLLGGLAAAIPLALHFFYRARYRPQPWAAMKFLRLSIEQTSRRLRFQELILLILRVLICIVLALALARPALKSMSGGSGRDEGVDAILIIDTSYSMGIIEGEGDNRRSRFDRAKEAAIKVINHLPPRSTVQVLSCSDKAEHLGPNSTADLTGAKKLIEELTLSSRSTDFQEGLALAVQSFANTAGTNTKEIYLLSDMQRLGWERQSAALRSTCGEIKDKAKLYLVRVADEKSKIKNAAIIDVLSQDEVPHPGSRVGFTVLVRNSGSETLTNLSVTLKIDGQVIEKDPRSIERIGPHEVYPVTVTGEIKQPGFKTLTAQLGPDKSKQPAKAASDDTQKELPADDLDTDNTFSRIVYVHERVRVLVIDGKPNADKPEFAASFYLGNALLPVPEEKRLSYHVGLRILSTESAGPGELNDCDICILTNVDVAALPPEFTRGLEDFVRTGKGLIVIAGSNVQPKKYNELLRDLLPAALIESPPIEAPADEWFMPDMDGADPQSFLTLRGGGIKVLQNLGLWFTRRVLPVADPKDVPAAPGLGKVLLRFHNGLPLLLSKQVEHGEVLLLTRPVDKTWGLMEGPNQSLPFPNFINGCVAHLVERSTSAFNERAGEPLQWDVPDPNKKYYLVKPDRLRVYLGEPKSEAGGPPRVTAYDTSKAGVYQILAENQNESEGQRFAVNPDLRESDSFEALSPDQLNAQLGYKPVHLTTGFDGSEFTGTERTRNEWTIWALVALLIFGFGELIWAWVCGRSW